jgi:hypothetical protein
MPTREEIREVKSRLEAAGYVQARVSIIMAALRAESIGSLKAAVKSALDTVKREIWFLAGDTREAVQMHVQSALASTVHRLDKDDIIDLPTERYRLGLLLKLAPEKHDA